MGVQQAGSPPGALGRWVLASHRRAPPDVLRSPDGDALEIQRWVAVFRRRAMLMLVVGCTILALFLTVLFVLPEKYTAESEVLVDARHEQIVNTQPVVQDLQRSTQEANIVDTQVEMLRSRSLARKVVQQLNLVNDPEFNLDLPGATGPAAWLHDILAPVMRLLGNPPPSAAKTREKVIDAVLGKLSISRDGLTYVIGVNFTSTDAAKASRIANAFADNYLSLTFDTKANASREVNTWLNQRLDGLRQQVEQSDAAVQRFKIENNLLTAAGTPLTEQEISSYNQQAAGARAQLAEDQARLSTARAQLARGSNGDDLGEALGSDTIHELRSQQAVVSARLAGFRQRYGPRHPDLLKAQQELADIDAQIHTEIQRIISNLQAKVEVSRERLGSIQATLNSTQGVLAANNRASVRLNELQRNADSAKQVYESFLSRYKETSALGAMAQPDAQLLSWASVPSQPSFPDLKVDLALGVLVALMGGLAAATAAELFNSGLSTADEVERRTGAPHVGSVPWIGSRRHRVGSPSAYLASKPLSAFAEALKGVRTSLLDAGGEAAPKVVVITSSLPGEGKTFTSVCLAGSLALQGYRTLLIDCDPRRASLSRQMTTSGTGLLGVLQGKCTLAEAVERDARTGAEVLPFVRDPDAPPDLFEPMRALLERLRGEYDMVILDTPPVLGVADTRILARLADAVLLLVQWRKTPRKAVETSLTMLRRTGARIAGVALTQVDLKQQSRTGYGDPGYYYARYKGYYVE